MGNKYDANNTLVFFSCKGAHYIIYIHVLHNRYMIDYRRLASQHLTVLQ